MHFISIPLPPFPLENWNELSIQLRPEAISNPSTPINTQDDNIISTTLPSNSIHSDTDSDDSHNHNNEKDKDNDSCKNEEEEDDFSHPPEPIQSSLIQTKNTFSSFCSVSTISSSHSRSGNTLTQKFKPKRKYMRKTSVHPLLPSQQDALLRLCSSQDHNNSLFSTCYSSDFSSVSSTPSPLSDYSANFSPLSDYHRFSRSPTVNHDLTSSNSSHSPISLLDSSGKRPFKVITWNLQNLDLTVLAKCESCKCTQWLRSFEIAPKKSYSVETKRSFRAMNEGDSSSSSSSNQKDNSHFFVRYDSSLMNDLAALQSQAREKLLQIVDHLLTQDADVIFLQEIRNSCSLRMLTAYLNFSLSSRSQVFSSPLSSFFSSDIPYLSMIEKDLCSPPSDLSQAFFSKSSSFSPNGNNHSFQLKGIIYRSRALMTHPLMIVPSTVHNNISLFHLASGISSTTRGDQFPLGECGFSALLFPTPKQLSDQDKIWIEEHRKEQKKTEGSTMESLLNDTLLGNGVEEDSHPLPPSFFLSSSFTDLLQSISLPLSPFSSAFSLYLSSQSSFSSFKSIFCSSLHLRSQLDPTNAYVRDAQVKQLSSWLNSVVLPHLYYNGVLVSHWMTLGDFNDYDNDCPDWIGNTSNLLGMGMDDSKPVLCRLKTMYQEAAVRYPMTFSSASKALINTACLRDRSTRFTNSSIADYRNLSRGCGAICHILVSPDLEFEQYSIFGCKTVGLSSFSLFPLLKFSIFTLCIESYLSGFYCSKLLGADLSSLSPLDYDLFLQRKRSLFSYSSHSKGTCYSSPQFKRYRSFAPQLNALGSIVEERNLFLKDRRPFYILLAKLSEDYQRHIAEFIYSFPNKDGRIDLYGSRKQYPSDHVSVHYSFLV